MKIKEELRKQVNGVFDELGLMSLTEEEKRALEEKIMERLDRVVLEATLLSLNEDQLKEFKRITEEENEEDVESLITELTSTVPGLAARIDMAIRNEWDGIKRTISQK